MIPFFQECRSLHYSKEEENMWGFRMGMGIVKKIFVSHEIDIYYKNYARSLSTHKENNFVNAKTFERKKIDRHIIN